MTTMRGKSYFVWEELTSVDYPASATKRSGKTTTHACKEAEITEQTYLLLQPSLKLKLLLIASSWNMRIHSGRPKIE